ARTPPPPRASRGSPPTPARAGGSAGGALPRAARRPRRRACASARGRPAAGPPPRSWLLRLVQSALGLLGSRPAALATCARLRARCAPDRLVPLVVQPVVGQVALVDPSPQVLVGPVRERVVLPQAAF